MNVRGAKVSLQWFLPKPPHGGFSIFFHWYLCCHRYMCVESKTCYEKNNNNKKIESIHDYTPYSKQAEWMFRPRPGLFVS